jgi:hypothetical protein
MIFDAFTFRAMTSRGCDRCGAEPGWPCQPEGKKQLAVGLHAERLIAQSAADLAAGEAAPHE